MKKILGMLSLATLPLAAQSFEVGAFVGQQSYNSFTVAGLEAKPDSKTIGALRFGYSPVDIGPCLFQVNAAFQPKASSEIKFSGLGVSGVGIGMKMDHQSTAIGVAFVFKVGFSASVGVDYRWDKMSADVSGTAASMLGGAWDGSATYARPWVRGNIGFAFPTPIMKPFLGLEVAAALGSKSVDSTSGPATNEEALKALAPKMQIGLYAGIRF